MSIFEHSRFEIWNQSQHPFRHTLEDFAFSSDALPGVSTVEGAFNYILAVLFPNVQAPVDTTADLPSVGNTLNDMRVVEDDGDGKAASYRWEQREGDASAKWYKIYDMDWGSNSILEAFQLRTQDLYVHRQGYDDLDYTGAVVSGTLAGQRIFGGKSANSNLTLSANSGDGVGSNTGYVQVTDHFRPTSNNALDVGSASEQFRTGRFATSVLASTLTLSGGSIVDSSGAISFDNENLSTTGTLASGTHTIGDMVLSTSTISNTSGAISFDNENLTTTGTLASGTHTIGTLVLAAASITDTSGSISFDNESLSTTGTLSAGNTTVTRLDSDNLRLDGNTLSSLNTDGNIILLCNGTGVVDIQSALTTIGVTTTGTLAVTGQLNADNLRLDGNTLSSTNTDGNIALSPNGTGVVTTSAKINPTTNGTLDLGATGSRYQNIYFSGSLGDGTTTIANSVLQSLRDINVGATSGMTIFFDGTKWNASLPDTEVDHGTITGLADDDHTQYALLAGRSGGQTLIGGTAANNDLTLQSTAHATRGEIIFNDVLKPGADGTKDIGESGASIKDLYIAGQAFGMRLENATTAGEPSASASTKGRLYWNTDTKSVNVDIGGSWQRVNVEKYSIQDASGWTGSVSSVVYTVSSLMSDARTALWMFYSNADTFEELNVKITKSQTQVTVTSVVNLAAGTYTLVGVG